VAIFSASYLGSLVRSRSSAGTDDVQVGCNDNSSCRIHLPTDSGLCPALDVPCGQWVNLYLDGNGNLQSCYASGDGCYNPGPMTADANTNSVPTDLGITSDSTSTQPQQEQKQQPPSLLRGRKLTLN
jgi:hypothetical protein